MVTYKVLQENIKAVNQLIGADYEVFRGYKEGHSTSKKPQYYVTRPYHERGIMYYGTAREVNAFILGIAHVGHNFEVRK